MIYLLIAIIVLLSVTIVVLSINFRKAQLSHNRKVSDLHYVIAQLTADSDEKLAQLELSVELRLTLQSARDKLDRQILELQHDLVGKIVQHGLVD